jgi:hypothetical protein
MMAAAVLYLMHDNLRTVGDVSSNIVSSRWKHGKFKNFWKSNPIQRETRELFSSKA